MKCWTDIITQRVETFLSKMEPREFVKGIAAICSYRVVLPELHTYILEILQPRKLGLHHRKRKIINEYVLCAAHYYKSLPC